MTTLNRSADNYGLSLILGGAEGKLWDISSMYLSMAQQLNFYNEDGRYYELNQPSYILNKNNGEKGDRIRNPLFSAGAIWQTFDALSLIHI